MNSVLRVGIDGRAFVSPAAGVRRYVASLVSALLAPGDTDIVALGGSGTGLPGGVSHVPEPAHPPGTERAAAESHFPAPRRTARPS